MGAMLFQSAEPNFINPSRVSPLDLSSRVSVGSSQTNRLHVGDRVAVCVSALCCTESFISAPKRIGGKSERQRKWISGVFHDQDWERFEALMCLLFAEKVMYAQITDKAISLQTMISPDLGRAECTFTRRRCCSLFYHSLAPLSCRRSERAKRPVSHVQHAVAFEAR